MGTNTLETAYVNGDIIDAAHINELTQSLLGSFVGRDTSGVPTTGRSLGTLALPWGQLYCEGIVLNGTALDVSSITSSPNRIISGAMRTLSSMPDFIRANGAALSFQVLGATTNLVLAVNNVATTVSTDITKTGVTAAPSSNNTCAVNDATISNDKYVGEDGNDITIGTVGSEISSRVGQLAAFSNGTEIMLAYIKSSTKLSDVRRGYFFDSSGNPLVRANLSHTNTLTLLSLGWVFIEDNGTTVDVSYKSPVYSYSAPSSPVTGDYWYDLGNNVWKRYSGASFDIIDRTLVGMVASNTTNTIGSRCFDFDKKFESQNSMEVELFSTEIARSKKTTSSVSVYGTLVNILSNNFQWNITTDLETGLTEANSTVYYLYMSDKAQPFISTEKPHWRPELRGDYHPYHSWRLLGMAYNDGSGNFTVVWTEAGANIFRTSTTSGTFSTTSATYVTATGQTVNFLARGRKEMTFHNIADGTNSHAMGVSRSASGAAQFRFYLDSATQIADYDIRPTATSATTHYIPASSAWTKYKPKVGYHTAEFQAKGSDATHTAYVYGNYLSVEEDAK